MYVCMYVYIYRYTYTYIYIYIYIYTYTYIYIYIYIFVSFYLCLSIHICICIVVICHYICGYVWMLMIKIDQHLWSPRFWISTHVHINQLNPIERIPILRWMTIKHMFFHHSTGGCIWKLVYPQTPTKIPTTYRGYMVFPLFREGRWWLFTGSRPGRRSWQQPRTAGPRRANLPRVAD